MQKKEREANEIINEKLDALNSKLDLLFSLMSNDLLSKQALQVHGAMSHKLGEAETDIQQEQLSKVVSQALDAYKMHAENINDSIEFYSRIHGEQAENSLKSLVEGLDDGDDVDSDVLDDLAEATKEAKKSLDDLDKNN